MFRRFWSCAPPLLDPRVSPGRHPSPAWPGFIPSRPSRMLTVYRRGWGQLLPSAAKATTKSTVSESTPEAELTTESAVEAEPTTESTVSEFTAEAAPAEADCGKAVAA